MGFSFTHNSAKNLLNQSKMIVNNALNNATLNAGASTVSIQTVDIKNSKFNCGGDFNINEKSVQTVKLVTSITAQAAQKVQQDISTKIDNAVDQAGKSTKGTAAAIASMFNIGGAMNSTSDTKNVKAAAKSNLTQETVTNAVTAATNNMNVKIANNIVNAGGDCNITQEAVQDAFATSIANNILITPPERS